jgi:hypothetical protein
LHKLDVLFFVVLLTKPDAPVSQTGLSGFGKLSICFSNFIYYDSLVICITYYLFTYTFFAHLGCIHIGELSWISLKNVENDIVRPKLNSIQYAHIWGKLTLYVWIQNDY